MSRGRKRRIAGGIGLAALGIAAVGVWSMLTVPKNRPHLDPALWHAFQARFVTADGRVVDRDSDSVGVTHTEGQGYGLLLAEAAGDHAGFEALWAWTSGHLRRPDGLFSWRFGKCGQVDCITDRNDASDGDILIAWALLRAGKDWDRRDYRDEARNIAASVADREIVVRGAMALLLPGSEGFQDDRGVVVNLSYWVFPAFQAFAAAFQDPKWQSLAESGAALLQQARFGEWDLPPDWLRIDGDPLRPADGFPARYGFNAVRVPLHLVWAGNRSPTLLAPFRAFWHAPHPKGVPAWVDLNSNEVAPYAWSTGVQAIAALADDPASSLPLPGREDGYFSWSLALLSRVAAAETPP